MPTKLTIPTNTKPGQIYDANLQCELMHGPGYQQVTPRQDAFDGICYMMWCGQSSFGRIITSHPALEAIFPEKEEEKEKKERHVLWAEQMVPAWTLCAVGREQLAINYSSKWKASPYCPYFCFFMDFTQIGLAISRRTCSNPYPANGGEDCVGSKIRAIVCNKPCPKQLRTVDEHEMLIAGNGWRKHNGINRVGANKQFTLKWMSNAFSNRAVYLDPYTY
ncbi:unnamed protein product [Haemonchus placei]|uniref:ADAM_CR_2 domain-containing protein n=1 Tax=Haemonchus placei TaxID=6290 RepID=A0A0N4WBP4_HAEPC|nr:unnamed protein product [Haemonchus placei]